MPTSARLSGFTELPLNAATPQLCLRRPTFSVLPEKVGKKRRLRTRYIARSRARFLFNALFGRKADTVPIDYGSDECTTRICGQTASISFLLILGILGGRANVGIGPYKRIQNHVRVDDSARLFHNEFALPAHT